MKSVSIIFLAVIFVFILLSSCKKEDAIINDDTVIDTPDDPTGVDVFGIKILAVTEVTETSAYLHGEVLDGGRFAVHVFYWPEGDSAEMKSEILATDVYEKGDTVDLFISGLSPGMTYICSIEARGTEMDFLGGQTALTTAGNPGNPTFASLVDDSTFGGLFFYQTVQDDATGAVYALADNRIYKILPSFDYHLVWQKPIQPSGYAITLSSISCMNGRIYAGQGSGYYNQFGDMWEINPATGNANTYSGDLDYIDAVGYSAESHNLYFAGGEFEFGNSQSSGYFDGSVYHVTESWCTSGCLPSNIMRQGTVFWFGGSSGEAFYQKGDNSPVSINIGGELRDVVTHDGFDYLLVAETNFYHIKKFDAADGSLLIVASIPKPDSNQYSLGFSSVNDKFLVLFQKEVWVWNVGVGFFEKVFSFPFGPEAFYDLGVFGGSNWVKVTDSDGDFHVKKLVLD